MLCVEFLEEISYKLNIPIYGRIENFKDVFALLMDYSKENPITLIVDEFQEFFNINLSVFSEIQNIWDANKSESKINLIFCGSMYSLMKRIFQNSKEPLFGRATHRMHIKAFNIQTLKN